ncbi:hypothetical protein CPB86DRAFT_819205 [Serendipita vermifera]|nr:hypothetical protein CPB86DRAFT_819205 [Serendipita vermifera]
MTSTTSSFKLCCLAFEPDRPPKPSRAFIVSIPREGGANLDVSKLQEMILDQFPCTPKLALESIWKSTDRFPLHDDLVTEKALREIQFEDEGSNGAQGHLIRLTPTTIIDEHFLSEMMENHINIVLRMTPESSISNHTGALASTAMIRFPSDDVDDVLNCYDRADMTERLYERLQKHRFVLVLGTPGSGKTVASKLIKVYISTREKNTKIFRVASWAKPSERAINGYLTQRFGEYWRRDDPGLVLIIDDAQKTYDDQVAWDEFRYICSNVSKPTTRVILFSSYGSPDGELDIVYTPIQLSWEQRVFLRPEETNDGSRPVGLFLTKEEFHPLIEKEFKHYHVDDTFLQWTYDVSAGQVGGIIEIFRFIEPKEAYSKCDRKHKFTLQDFIDTIPQAEFTRHLLNSTIFGKGTPKPKHLVQLPIRRVLEIICLEGEVKESRFTSVEDRQVLKYCHKRGWLYSYTTQVSDTSFFFSTPLHRWLVGFNIWQTEPTEPPEDNLFDFLIRHHAY